MNLVTKHFAGGFVTFSSGILDVFLPPALRALCPRAGNIQPGSLKLGEQAGAMAVRPGLNLAAPPL